MRFDFPNADRWTSRAKSVFAEADALAMCRGAFQIAPEDLLLALSRRDRGVGRVVLEGFAIELDKLQDELARLAPQNDVATCRSAAPGFSPESLHVLGWAEEEATALEHNYLGTEHLVLGLIRDTKSKAGSFLRERSASSERAREILRSILYGDECV